jgi:hypothetical protein
VKMKAIFRFFSVFFRFVPFSFRFRFLHFASMRNKRKKHFFFASKRKKFLFRFASFRFEAKMTAHPNPDPYQSEKQDPEPYQKGLYPQH